MCSNTSEVSPTSHSLMAILLLYIHDIISDTLQVLMLEVFFLERHAKI